MTYDNDPMILWIYHRQFCERIITELLEWNAELEIVIVHRMLAINIPSFASN